MIEPLTSIARVRKAMWMAGVFTFVVGSIAASIVLASALSPVGNIIGVALVFYGAWSLYWGWMPVWRGWRRLTSGWGVFGSWSFILIVVVLFFYIPFFFAVGYGALGGWYVEYRRYRLSSSVAPPNKTVHDNLPADELLTDVPQRSRAGTGNVIWFIPLATFVVVVLIFLLLLAIQGRSTTAPVAVGDITSLAPTATGASAIGAAPTVSLVPTVEATAITEPPTPTLVPDTPNPTATTEIPTPTAIPPDPTAVIPVPTLISPSNGSSFTYASLAPHGLILQWSPIYAQYDIEVWGAMQISVTQHSPYYFFANNPATGTYFWHIRSDDGNNRSPWSDTWQFTLL